MVRSNQERPQPQATGTAASSARNGTATITARTARVQRGSSSSSITGLLTAYGAPSESSTTTIYKTPSGSAAARGDRRGPGRVVDSTTKAPSQVTIARPAGDGPPRADPRCGRSDLPGSVDGGGAARSRIGCGRAISG